MWNQALDFLEQANRLEQEFFQSDLLPSWEPAIDMFEDQDTIWILVALVGIKESEFEVVLENGEIVIRGERLLPKEIAAGAIRYLEIPYGFFERRIVLPWMQLQLIERVLEQGCLRLGLRKLR